MAGPGDREIFDQFQSIFSDLFGGAPPTRDLSLPLTITLAEAANGGERSVALNRATRCRPCAGKGGAPGATYETCASCAGQGGTSATRGGFVLSTPCAACHGTRGRWSEPCASCKGRGETSASKSVAVQLPPGIDTGQIIRLAGQGNDLGEGPGDALLTIAIAPHPTLRRVGADLHTRVRLDAELAELGGEVSVAWLSGTARVRAPAHVADDVDIRLRGWGCVHFGSAYVAPPTDASPYRAVETIPRGDLIVTLSIRDAPEPTSVDDAALERALAEHDASPSVMDSHRYGMILVALAGLAISFAMLWARSS